MLDFKNMGNWRKAVIGFALGAALFGGGTIAYATGAFPIGVGGTGQVTFTSSQLIYGNGTNPFRSVATTTVTCAGTASCTTFTVIGSTPVTITGSGGASASWPFTPTTNYGVPVQSTSTPIWDTAGFMASSTSYFVFASTTALSVGANTFIQSSATSTFGAGLSATYLNLSGNSATSTFANGADLAAGCWSQQGSCLSLIASGASAYKQAVKYATTAALPANNYSNGASGVGATITEIGNGALSVDSAAPAVGDRVLIKNEGAGANNGVYTVTAAGSGIAVFVLTRATDYNSSADVFPGVANFVNSGTVNANTCWILTNTTSVVIGTTALTYDDACGAGSISGNYPITVNGTTVSFSGLSTTTAWTQGNLAYVSGTSQNQVGSVATTSQTLPANMTTSGTFGALVGGVTGTLSQFQPPSFTVSTSSWVGTTTFMLRQVISTETFNGVRCKVTPTGATLNVQFGIWTASTTMINASSTNNFNLFTANNALAAGNIFAVEVGTPAGTPTQINCTTKITD